MESANTVPFCLSDLLTEITSLWDCVEHEIRSLGLAALIPRADDLVREVGDESCLRSQTAPLRVGRLEAGYETF